MIHVLVDKVPTDERAILSNLKWSTRKCESVTNYSFGKYHIRTDHKSFFLRNLTVELDLLEVKWILYLVCKKVM